MPSLPRPSQGTACRDRFPFDHLTLAEIDEARRLWRKLASGECDERDKARLSYLNKRRVLPQYEPVEPGAA